MLIVKQFLVLLTLALLSCSNRTPKVNISEEMNVSNDTSNQLIQQYLNRKVYKKLTGEIIAQTPDDQLLTVVYDNIESKFPRNYRKEYKTLMTLSEGRQAIYIIWYVEGEVNNGGFNQFYFNSSGQYAQLAPEAFKLVGAEKYAELMQRANNTYRSNEKSIRKSHDGTLEGFSESYKDNPLNELDHEFYKLYKTEELRQLQISFRRNNADQFTDK